MFFYALDMSYYQIIKAKLQCYEGLKRPLMLTHPLVIFYNWQTILNYLDLGLMLIECSDICSALTMSLIFHYRWSFIMCQCVFAACRASDHVEATNFFDCEEMNRSWTISWTIIRIQLTMKYSDIVHQNWWSIQSVMPKSTVLQSADSGRNFRDITLWTNCWCRKPD